MAANPSERWTEVPGPVPSHDRLKNIGVIGLGVMGAPVARNLAKAGFGLTVFNRSAASAEPFRGDARVASSAREVFESSDAVVLLVPGEAEIDAVLERSGSRIGAPVRDTALVNMATVAPPYSERLGAEVEAAGGTYVEAPLSGSRTPAEAGQLVVLAAGRETAIDRLEPLFAAIGRATVRCGTPPDAMRMKLANNLLLITLLEGFVEAAHFARGLGLDLERFMDVVLAGPMANDVLRSKAAKLLARDFTKQAPIRHVAKDIRLVDEEARRARVRAPVAAVNAGLFARAVERGLGDEDVIGILKVLESAQGP